MPDPERNLKIGVAQHALGDRDVVDVAAVRGLQVLDRPRLAGAVDARVAPRNGIAVDLDVTVRAAAEHDLVAGQREPLPHVGAGWIDEHEARFTGLLGGLDDLDLRDAGLPLAHRKPP